MGARLRRLLRVHPGEGSVAARMLLLMLLVWTGATIGSSGVDSLLFSRYGPRALPYLFVALGLVAFPVMATLGALLQRADRERVLIMLPLILGVALLAARAALVTGAKFIYPLLWLVMMVIWTVEATGAWGVATTVNDTRQAKRLFPLYGAGLIMGSAAGGLLTAPLAEMVHAENLLFVWAGALVAAALIVRSLIGGTTSRVRRYRGRKAKHAGVAGVFRDARQGFRFVSGSPLLRWLAAAMGLFSLLYSLLSFPFAQAVTVRFPDTDRLAAFLGLFTGLINGTALLVSLFLANRLFARFGVATMVLTFGIIYLAGFAALSIVAGFALLLAFRFVQMMWMNGVWTTGWRSLFTIVPAERRGQVAAFMDGGSWQGGMMLAGITLIVTDAFLGRRSVFFLGVVGAAAVTLAMWRARGAYGRAVAEAVRAGRPDVFLAEDEPFGGFRTDAAAVAALIEGAGDPDVGVRRVAMQIAAGLRSHEVLPALMAGAADEDPEVKAAALEGLALSPDPSASPIAARALSQEDPVVRARGVDALVACWDGAGDLEARLRPLLSDPDPRVRARAAVGLARGSSDPEGGQYLAGMLRSPDPVSRAAAAASFGDLGQRADLLQNAMTDGDPAVRRAVVLALARLTDGWRVGVLISALRDPDAGVRDAAVAAMKTVGYLAVEGLEDALADPALEVEALRALVEVGWADPERLLGYARGQVAKATHYGRLAQGLASNGDERVALLAFSVRHKLLHHATNALMANAALADADGLRPAIESLTSPEPTQRANALEALDALGEPEIVGPLLAVWEGESERSGQLAAVVGELLTDDDPWLRACAALAMESLPQGALDNGRKVVLSDPDRDALAVTLLRREGAEDMETLDTLSLMERVLFLRKVSLFAELVPADLRYVAGAAVENLYPDGDLIAAKGDAGDVMHVVVSGEIRVGVGDDRTSVELARRGPGEVVGEMALITEEPRMASMVATGDVRTLSIDRRRFHRILAERPEVSLAIMRQLCARLTQSLEDRADP